MTEIVEKSNYLKLEFKKSLTDKTPIDDIILPLGKTTAFDCEMIKKPSDLADGSVVVIMKSWREDCLPQTLRVALVNGKLHMIFTNTGQGEVAHLQKSKHWNS